MTSMRSVWLVVLNDGTDEVTNMHALEVPLDPERPAYFTLRDVMQEAYGEDDYPVDDDETNGYLLLPAEARQTDLGRYVATKDVLNADGEVFYATGEVLEDPIGRSFMLFFVDPEQMLSTTKDTLLNALSCYPAVEQRFLLMSEILLILDALRTLPDGQ